MRTADPTRPNPPLGEVERYIAALAQLWGWRHHRTPAPSLTPEGYADGFPGEVLLRGGRLLFVTIAAPGGVLIPPAAAWAGGLEAASNIEALVLRREDLHPVRRALRPAGGIVGLR
jgi:hypothetical protein